MGTAPSLLGKHHVPRETPRLLALSPPAGAGAELRHPSPSALGQPAGSPAARAGLGGTGGIRSVRKPPPPAGRPHCAGAGMAERPRAVPGLPRGSPGRGVVLRSTWLLLMARRRAAACVTVTAPEWRPPTRSPQAPSGAAHTRGQRTPGDGAHPGAAHTQGRPVLLGQAVTGVGWACWDSWPAWKTSVAAPGPGTCFPREERAS